MCRSEILLILSFTGICIDNFMKLSTVFTS